MNVEVLLSACCYERPEVKEVSNRDYVLNEYVVDNKRRCFYNYIIDRYNGSPTNRAIIDSYAQFIYGKGLTSTEQASKPLQFASIKSMLSKKDLRNICADFAIFGEASLELIYSNGKLNTIRHIPRQLIAPSKLNEEGEITSYWYCQDFYNVRKYPPVEIESFYYKQKSTTNAIYIIQDYQVGRKYFTDPSYLAGLPYAMLEEEIANYCVNHIQNGLSFGHIINMNNGMPESEEVKKKLRQEFTDKLAGSKNAGKFIISYNDNKDNAATVEALEVSEAHKQYEFLSSEATQKLMIAHKVTSPILFGIKDSTGLGNNANEMESAFNELMINVIQPKKEIILDSLMEIFASEGMTIDLDFIPLRQIIQPTSTNLSKQEIHLDDMVADILIELGEEIDINEWEEIDTVKMEGKPELEEISLNLASVPSSFPNASSEQDTTLFKIRYVYSGSLTPQRAFCAKMMGAGKVYRKEDIELAGDKVVNAGFGPYGSDKYDIWLYKGGPNCQHFWERKIYLRRNNKSISSTEAREILNNLEPSERGSARIERNNPLVAKRPEDMPNHGYLN